MSDPLQPENLSLLLLCVSLGLGGLGIYRLVLWVRALPVTPDPWSPDVAKNLEEPDALPICHKCITPQPHGQWFCEHCGTAVGDYNNMMPYLYAFSVGEVLRNARTERMPKNALIIAGYALITLSSFAMFACISLIPVFVFWYFLLKNFNRVWETESLPGADEQIEGGVK